MSAMDLALREKTIQHKNKLLELLRAEGIDAKGSVVLGDQGLEIRIEVLDQDQHRRAHTILPLEMEGRPVLLK